MLAKAKRDSSCSMGCLSRGVAFSNPWNTMHACRMTRRRTARECWVSQKAFSSQEICRAGNTISRMSSWASWGWQTQYVRQSPLPSRSATQRAFES
jgi:hypothetical protein